MTLDGLWREMEGAGSQGCRPPRAGVTVCSTLSCRTLGSAYFLPDWVQFELLEVSAYPGHPVLPEQSCLAPYTTCTRLLESCLTASGEADAGARS